MRLLRLLRWREAHARRADRPRSWILDNELAVLLARDPGPDLAAPQRQFDTHPTAPRKLAAAIWQAPPTPRDAEAEAPEPRNEDGDTQSMPRLHAAPTTRRAEHGLPSARTPSRTTPPPPLASPQVRAPISPRSSASSTPTPRRRASWPTRSGRHCRPRSTTRPRRPNRATRIATSRPCAACRRPRPPVAPNSACPTACSPPGAGSNSCSARPGVPATTGPGRFQAGAAPNSNRCSRPCSLRKRKVLASRPAAPYNPQPRGAVAQLGERRVRIAKVVGSIPIRSTIPSSGIPETPPSAGFLSGHPLEAPAPSIVRRTFCFPAVALSAAG